MVRCLLRDVRVSIFTKATKILDERAILRALRDLRGRIFGLI